MSIDFNKYPLPKRFRHHTAPNLYFPAKELKVISRSYPPIIKEVKWGDHFINGKKPDVLDIGCGKGLFLLEMALNNPGKNFLGIEVRKQAVNWIQTVIDGEQLANCGIMWYTVVNGMPFIENRSIEKIFYLFPDPWTKKRLKRRRAFNDNFLEETARVLKPDGELLLASDVKEVFDDQEELLKESNKFNCTFADEKSWPYPPTNKERFCIRESIDYYRMICKLK